MSRITEFIQAYLDITPDTQISLFETIAIIVAFVLIRAAVVTIARRYTNDGNDLHRWRRRTELVLVVVGVITIFRIWISEVSSLATYLGLLSAGLAVALSDLISNLAGWLHIVSRQPFEVGDRIQIGDDSGDVVDVRFFHFSLIEIGNWVEADQSTGRLLHVPNRRVYTHTVANYTTGFGFIWHEMPINFTIESNWEKAKLLLLTILEQHTTEMLEKAALNNANAQRRETVKIGRMTPIVYTSLKNTGTLTLTMRFLCEPRRRRGSSGAIWEAILKELRQHDDIQLAFPTQRVYANVVDSVEPPNLPHA